MAERTIRTGVGTYLGADGIWRHGLFGEDVDVHDDDLERFDRLNPEEPKAETDDGEQTDGEREFPEGDPVEDWKGNELKAYAKAHGFDIGSASKKADIVAALVEAKAAAEQEQAEGEQPPADE